MAKAGFVGLTLGDAHLGISQDPASGAGPTERFSLWVYADDCDAAVEHLRANGVTIVEEPIDQPWGERVARVLDPDGNLMLVARRGDVTVGGERPISGSLGSSDTHDCAADGDGERDGRPDALDSGAGDEVHHRTEGEVGRGHPAGWHEPRLRHR